MGENRALPIWRSMLFVPAIARKFVEGAPKRGADAIILDLEDSVPATEKSRARSVLQEAAEIAAQDGADIVVRINRPLRLAIPDIEAAISARVAALALPKIESASHVQLLSEVVAEMEAERGLSEGHTRFLLLVETASTFFHLEEVARAHPRVVAMTLGSEDFATAIGMVPEAENLFFPKQQMVIAARAAGIMPMGFVGSIADFRDLDAFRATIRRSRRMGFVGAPCIHPSQVTILNQEFAPSADEIAHAERVVAAYEKATAEGVGAIQIDGRMIDVPIVERAQAVLARQRAIAAREARKA